MGSFEPLIAPIADDHLRAKGAVRHEPCARLVARMFTFWAKKIAYCIVRNDRDCRCASNSASDWNCAGPGSDRFHRAATLLENACRREPFDNAAPIAADCRIFYLPLQDYPDIRTRGILGFAIQRTRHVMGAPSHPSERVSKALSLGRMGRTAASAVDFRCLDRHDR
ncbi:hypothetical protein CN193_30690 [Sinorhizobium meliloti]|nr:hypothetical protein CN189_23340 [Sinorhizobium meliloti]RVI93829.1 hypothetical protein CN193_30690 [Sinorhizobium meliloti]